MIELREASWSAPVLWRFGLLCTSKSIGSPRVIFCRASGAGRVFHLVFKLTRD
jgi:hypothetical protein